jgi:hypothetical protein
LHLNAGLPELSMLKSAASRVNPTCGVKPGNDAEWNRYERIRFKEPHMDHAQIEAIVKRAAREAVLETLALLGFDLDNKPEMRADMAHLRRWRRSVDQAGSFGLKAFVTIAATSLAGAIWLGIKTMLGKVN